MWIKICGITSLQDAQTAFAAGANALGFVFAESPRQVIPEVVREIVGSLPASVEKVGVFVDSTLEEIASTVHTVGLTGVQLHGASREIRVQDLRNRLGPAGSSLRVVQVVRYGGDPHRFSLELQEMRGSGENVGHCRNGADAVLVDTCVNGRHGGTGVAFDWASARDSFVRAAPRLRIIAAGGLHPGNVVRAIQTLQPWGVDVSSGVESSPGRKDPDRVVAFISLARAAEKDFAQAAVEK